VRTIWRCDGLRRLDRSASGGKPSSSLPGSMAHY
jgi:hypothetical protein